MGRWAQRTRCGGGQSINFITAVRHDDPETMIVTFNSTIDANWFNGADFQASPSDEFADSVSQNSAKEIVVTWTIDVSADDFLNFQTSWPGFIAATGIPVT